MKQTSRTVTLLCVIGLLPSADPTRADILRLQNGRELEGRVRAQPDGSYEVFIEEGRVLTISGDDVVDHALGEAPIDRVERELGARTEMDRDALVDLAAWAEGKGLRRATLEIYRRILRLDPHHAGARRRLGYVLYQNRWVARRELEANGLVKFRGEWLTSAEIQRRRTQEHEAEFRALLAEAKSPNKYLRQNALLQILESRDPLLAPLLRQLLASDDPVERMISARVLGNHSFRLGAEPIYAALLKERRPEVQTALIAVLRGFGEERLARWMIRDFRRTTPNDVVRLRNLLALIESCPHRDVIPPLIDFAENQAWGSVADRTLSKILSAPRRSASAWRAHWRDVRDRTARDLGSGWLR